MIVPTEFWKKNTSKMIEESYNYLLVDTAHFQYAPEKDRFKYLIQIMDVCNTLRMANDMFSKLGVKKSFDFDILFEVAKAVISEIPFSNKQIKEYFKLMAEIEAFATGVQSFYSGIDSLMIDSEVEMLLIGFGYEKQKELDRLDETGNVHDEFFTLRYKVVKGEKKIDIFLREALDLLEGGINSIEDNGKKAA